MARKQRPTTYPRPPAWDRAWQDERRIVADADAFLAAALGDEAASELALIGGTGRTGRPWAPRQLISQYVPAPLSADAAKVATEPTVTVAGRTYLATDLDALEAEPCFERVSQSATTDHRDRRAFSRPTVRTFHRPPCDEAVTGKPCPRRTKSDGTASAHRCIAEGRTYVSATVPYGDDGSARSKPYSTTTRPLVTTTVRPVTAVHAVRITRHNAPGTPEHRSVIVHAVKVRTMRPVVEGAATGRERSYVRGRNLSPRQGRRTRRVTLGYFPDATYAVDPAAMVERRGWQAVMVPDDADTTRPAPAWSPWHAVVPMTDDEYRIARTAWTPIMLPSAVGMLPIMAPVVAPSGTTWHFYLPDGQRAPFPYLTAVTPSSDAWPMRVAHPAEESILERTWSPDTVPAGTYCDVPWVRPALVIPPPPRKVGRPRKASRGKSAERMAMERLQGAQRANVEAVLAALLTACDRARAVPDRTVAAVDGWSVTYRQAEGGTVVLLGPDGMHLASWRGRRSAARSVALDHAPAVAAID